MEKSSKIYVAGHRGLVGSALVRNLNLQGYNNIIYRTHGELDLTHTNLVDEFFQNERPEYVFLAAAKVGGIVANNTKPADFFLTNLKIQNNVIESAYKNGVRKLLFLGSSCIYPRLANQPIREDSLLTGLLEPTNEAYALAKIAGIKLCQSYNRQYATDYIACMPTNLYGSHDNFDLENSHVMPAMIRKFHEAKVNNHLSVTLWGDGTPFREFLYSDDMAGACIYLMNSFSPTREQSEHGDIFFNIGTGKDIAIRDLALLIQKIVGFEGEIVWDTTRPNGTPKKLLDVTRMESIGWKYSIELEDGIKMAYDWFLENK